MLQFCKGCTHAWRHVINTVNLEACGAYSVMLRWYLQVSSSTPRRMASRTDGYFLAKRATPSCESIPIQSLKHCQTLYTPSFTKRLDCCMLDGSATLYQRQRHHTWLTCMRLYMHSVQHTAVSRDSQERQLASYVCNLRKRACTRRAHE